MNLAQTTDELSGLTGGAHIFIALVTLAEGPRVLGELLGVDPDTTEDLIGAPVRIDFQHVDDELTLPVWRLA